MLHAARQMGQMAPPEISWLCALSFPLCSAGDTFDVDGAPFSPDVVPDVAGVPCAMSCAAQSAQTHRWPHGTKQCVIGRAWHTAHAAASPLVGTTALPIGGWPTGEPTGAVSAGEPIGTAVTAEPETSGTADPMGAAARAATPLRRPPQQANHDEPDARSPVAALDSSRRRIVAFLSALAASLSASLRLRAASFRSLASRAAASFRALSWRSFSRFASARLSASRRFSYALEFAASLASRRLICAAIRCLSFSVCPELYSGSESIRKANAISAFSCFSRASSSARPIFPCVARARRWLACRRATASGGDCMF